MSRLLPSPLSWGGGGGREGGFRFGCFCIGLMPHFLAFKGGVVRFFVCSGCLFRRRQVGLPAVMGISVGVAGLDVATRLWLCAQCSILCVNF